jgi:hypothetical protein
VAAMTILEKIAKIADLINQEIFGARQTRISSPKVRNALFEILVDSTTSFENFKEVYENLIALLEEKYESVVDLLVSMLADSLQNLTGVKDYPFNLEVKHPDSFPEDAYNLVVRSSRIDTTNVAPFFTDFEPPNISPQKLEEVKEYVKAFAAYCARDANCAEQKLFTLTLDLCLLRNLEKTNSKREVAYTFYGDLIQALGLNQRHQLARDLAVAGVQASFSDGLTELGYLIMVRVCNNSDNPIRAICFAIGLHELVRKKGRVSENLHRDLYYESIKTARSLRNSVLATFIYNNVPADINSTFTSRQAFANVYCYALANNFDQSLPNIAFAFLDNHITEIETAGPSLLTSWLVLMFRIKHEHNRYIVDLAALDGYIDRLKSKLEPSYYQKYENALFGDLAKVKVELAAALVKLAAAREKLDYVTENAYAYGIAHRVFVLSVEQKEIDGYLLSMIVKSDFSLVFKPRTPFSGVRMVKFTDEYRTPDELIAKVKELPDSEVLWLGCDRKMVCPLYFKDGQFRFLETPEWSMQQTISFAAQLNIYLNPPSDLSSGGFGVSELEHVLSFTRLELGDINNLLVVKDFELSNFPHNLILTPNGFVIDLAPVTNIMSLEWLFSRSPQTLSKTYTKSAWIPLENTSMEFHLIAHRLEPTFVRYGVKRIEEPIPKTALNANLNILVAHGDNHISNLPAVHVTQQGNDLTIFNLKAIIGDGDILVLFICHAGSQSRSNLQNQSKSIVKEYLQSGYACVIAPFWALHVDVPPVWLPEFLSKIENGETVAASVWKANLKVKEIYKTPKAYACLHFYGDPFFKMGG